MAIAPAKRAGFTLIELLTVMAIIAIIMAIGVMAFVDIGRNAGMRSSVSKFQSGLALARQWAITHRTRTQVEYNNSPTENRGYYLISAKGSAGLIGTTNFLSEGIAFQLVAPEKVEFKLDGTCNGGVGTWSAMQRDIVIKEIDRDVASSLCATVTVFQLTGRLRASAW